jgi:hypothetical protein
VEASGRFKNVNSEIKESYIKLETRLKGFMDNLILNTNKNTIGVSIISFLKLITTNYSCIPFRIFTMFEITRLGININTLSTFNNNQMAMVLCFYILIKILVKRILIENNGSTNIKSTGIKK